MINYRAACIGIITAGSLATIGLTAVRETTADGFMSRAELLHEIDNLEAVYNDLKHNTFDDDIVKSGTLLAAFVHQRLHVLNESMWYRVWHKNVIDELYVNRMNELIA